MEAGVVLLCLLLNCCGADHYTEHLKLKLNTANHFATITHIHVHMTNVS